MNINKLITYIRAKYRYYRYGEWHTSLSRKEAPNYFRNNLIRVSETEKSDRERRLTLARKKISK
jgi:hypothetical protein